MTRNMNDTLTGKIVYWVEEEPIPVDFSKIYYNPNIHILDHFPCETESIHKTATITRTTHKMVWLQVEPDKKKEFMAKPELLKLLNTKKGENKDVLKILKTEVELINNPPPPKFTKAKNQEDDVYTLKDPDTLEVFYVGISNNVLHRYKQHCNCIGDNNKAKNQRIQALRAVGKFPLLEVIDKTQRPHSFELERKWINYFLSIGAPLTNMTGINDIETVEVER